MSNGVYQCPQCGGIGMDDGPSCDCGVPAWTHCPVCRKPIAECLDDRAKGRCSGPHIPDLRHLEQTERSAMTEPEPEFARLLSEAVEAQIQADESWREVERAMDRHRPYGVIAIETWRQACDASGLSSLKFGEVFLKAARESRTARGIAEEVGRSE